MARSFVTADVEYLVNTVSAPLTATPFSVSMLVFPLDVSTSNTLFWMGDKALTNHQHLLLADGGASDKIRAGTSAGGGNFYSNSTAAYLANAWVQAGGVWTDPANRQAVLEGVLGSEENTSLNPTGEDSISIGMRRNGSPSFPANCYMAEVGLWDTDLNQADWDMLAARMSPIGVRPESLISYWPFIARGLSVEPDYVGNHPLTANGYAGGDENVPHPRVIYPTSNKSIFVPTVAPTGDPGGAAYHYNQMMRESQ